MDKLPEGFVLEEDTGAQTEGLPPGFVLEDADPMESQGILEKGRKALQYGTAQRLVGYGKTGEATIGYGKALEDIGKAIAPDNYRSASQDFFDPKAKDKGLMGYGWGYAPRAILESVPGLAADLGFGALTGGTGFVASNAAANFGPTLEARVQNNGGKDLKDATATDYLSAGAGTALNAYLNKVGISPAVNSVAKGAGLAAISQIPKQIAKAGAADALSGAVGNYVDQVATKAGTTQGGDINLKEIAGSGALSGATGASVRAARVPGDVVGAVRNSGFDGQSATRVADYLDNLPEKFNNGDSNYRGVRAAEDFFKKQASSAISGAKAYIDEVGAKPLITDLQTRLNHGYELHPEEIENLRGILGQRDDGIAVVNALKDRHTINQLKGQGTFDKTTEHFDSGLVGKFGNIIDPRRTIGRTAGKAAAAAGVASQYAIPFAGQIGLASGALAKFLALQAGTYVGAKAIDKVTGFSDPVRDFRDRFSGYAEQDAPVGVTTKDIRDREKALKKLNRVSRKPQDAQESPQATEAPPEAPMPSTDAYTALQKLQAIEEGVKNATPVEEAPKVQPKASKPLETAEAPVQDVPRRTVTHEGMTWEVPDDVVEATRWEAGLKAKQGFILKGLKKAKALGISEEAKSSLEEATPSIRSARNREDAKDIFEHLFSKMTEEDQKILRYHFGEPYFRSWKKETAGKMQ